MYLYTINDISGTEQLCAEYTHKNALQKKLPKIYEFQ